MIFKLGKPQVPDPLQPDRVFVARQVYFKRGDFEEHGFTEGCARCFHDRTHGFGRTSRPHSKAFRDRLMGELAKTEDGKRRLAITKDRLDRVAHDFGNHDGRQDLPSQGEIGGGSEARVDQEAPQIVDDSNPPDFLPMPMQDDGKLNRLENLALKHASPNLITNISKRITPHNI